MTSPETREREQAKKEKRSKRKNAAASQSNAHGVGDEDELTLSRRKEERQKKKVIERLAALGLDEHGEKLDHYSILKYPVREWRVTLLGSQEPIAFNPIVTLIGMVVLLSTALWISGTSINMEFDPALAKACGFLAFPLTSL
jgi:hypothetical protein